MKYLLCRYTGKLYAANEALPAKMNVRFPLSEIIIILHRFMPNNVIMIIMINVQTQSALQALWCWTLTTQATASSALAKRLISLSQRYIA